MADRELVIIVALILLLATSIYQAVEISKMKSVVEQSFPAKQGLAGNGANLVLPFGGSAFEGIPTKGQGCLI
jgi:hypothetical protein